MALPIEPVPPIALLFAMAILTILKARFKTLRRMLTTFTSFLVLILGLQLLDLLIGVMIVPATIISSSIPKGELTLGENWKQVLTDRSQNATSYSIQIGLYEPVQDRKWVVFACPNGARFEQLSRYLEIYSDSLDRNVLAFNYRGVGDSLGWPRSSHDLAADGLAATRYLVESVGVSPADILFHGWSLGGHVAIELKNQHPESCLVHDRSFSHLSRAAKAMMDKSPVPGAFLGSLAAVMLAGALGSSSVALLVAAVVGAAGGAVVVGPITEPVLQQLGWEMDSLSRWQDAKCSKDPRCVILFHQVDGMIPYASSSLHAAVVDGAAEKATLVELTGQFGSAQHNHLYPLHADKQQYEEVISIIKMVCG